MPDVQNPMTQPTSPAVWIDGDPLMEAIAAAVWEQCNTEPGSSVVDDDPRNIAAVAAAAARQILSATEQQDAVSATAARPIDLLRGVLHSARWAVDLTKQGQTDEANEHVDAIDRLTAAYRTATAKES